jgi:predicted nucleic acid-binding protein
MMLLDANVISQVMKPDGDQRPRDWLDGRDPLELFIGAPVLAELRYGALILSNGGKRDMLLAACDEIERKFERRILPNDAASAHRFAALRAQMCSQGRALPVVDGMIAAIALDHALTLVTRNLRDFEGLGLTLVDPFAPAGNVT